MRDATFTELRNQAKQFFDLVEAGETVRVSRNGKPIAGIHPFPKDHPSDTTPQVIQYAVSVLEANPLHGMDAIHIGAALACSAEVFLSADRRQCAAAKQAGLTGVIL